MSMFFPIQNKNNSEGHRAFKYQVRQASRLVVIQKITLEVTSFHSKLKAQKKNYEDIILYADIDWCIGQTENKEMLVSIKCGYAMLWPI